jgi:hypothetical protein
MDVVPQLIESLRRAPKARDRVDCGCQWQPQCEGTSISQIEIVPADGTSAADWLERELRQILVL